MPDGDSLRESPTQLEGFAEVKYSVGPPRDFMLVGCHSSIPVSRNLLILLSRTPRPCLSTLVTMRFYHLIAAATAVAALPAPEDLDKRDAQECYKAATSMLPKLTAIPTPDATLSSWLMRQTQLVTQTDTCVIPEITGSMAKEYSSYASKLSSYYDGAVDAYSSLLDACSDVPEINKELESITKGASFCTEMHWASETGSAKSSDSKDSKDDDNAASGAPIKVGIVAAVAAVAGLFVL
ncbi:hypothetical protein ACHAPT_010311 [Fusarium lateritium]